MIDPETRRPSPKGDVTLAGNRMRVVFQRTYRKPVERVWEAITTPAGITDWLGAATVDLRLGGAIRINYPDGYSSTFTINRLEPPRVLAWTWALDGIDTLVQFELTPSDGGCDLKLTHTDLDPRGGGKGVRAGWHAHLEGLADCLDGKATPWAIKERRQAEFAPLYPNPEA